MPVKNYIIATFIGSAPSMFITVALGSGIENIMEKLFSPPEIEDEAYS